MIQDIERYVPSVCDCLKQQKSQNQPRAKLQPIVATALLELLSVDYVYLKTSSGIYIGRDGPFYNIHTMLSNP